MKNNYQILTLILSSAFMFSLNAQQATIIEEDKQKAKVVENKPAPATIVEQKHTEGMVKSEKPLYNSKGLPYVEPRQKPMETREPADIRTVISKRRSLEGNSERYPNPRDTSNVIDITKMSGSMIDITQMGRQKPDVRELSKTGKADGGNVISIDREFFSNGMSEDLYDQASERFRQIQAGPDVSAFEIRRTLSSEMIPEDGDLKNKKATVIEE